MKPELAILTAHDRLATWEEIRRATSYTPDRVLELCYTQGTHCEIDSDSGGIIRFTFGTIMGGIAPIRNASKARFLDLFSLRKAGREPGLPKTSASSS